MTHITQETDQNYGEFKLSLCLYSQILSNELFCEYKVKQQQHNNGSANVSALSTLSLNHSHYGDLLSGQAADKKRDLTEIPLVFCNTFSVPKIKCAWEVCHVVPCMRKCVMHRCVHHGVSAIEFLNFE